MPKKTYFRILSTCTRYTTIDYGKPYEYIGLASSARKGDVLLQIGRVDLSFYWNEIEQIR